MTDQTQLWEIEIRDGGKGQMLLMAHRSDAGMSLFAVIPSRKSVRLVAPPDKLSWADVEEELKNEEDACP
jgi:hypothetical protein